MLSLVLSITEWVGRRAFWLCDENLVSCECQNAASAGAQVETYELISIDGQPLPCTINHGQAKLNVKAGVFRFRPDGQCESSIEFLAPDGQTFRKDVSGTFTRNGDEVNFQWKRAGRTAGTITGDKFTMNNEGIVFSYMRQR